MITKADGIHILLGDGDVLIGHQRWPDNERDTMLAFFRMTKPREVGEVATPEDLRAAGPPVAVIEFKDLAGVNNLIEHLFELRNGFEDGYEPRAVGPFSERQKEINKALEKEQLAVDLDTGTLTDEQRRVLEIRFGVRIDPHHNFVRSRYVQLLDDGPVPPFTFAVDPGAAGRVLVGGKPMTVADALNYVLRVAMEPPRWGRGKVDPIFAPITVESTDQSTYVNKFLASLTHADDAETPNATLYDAYKNFCVVNCVEDGVWLGVARFIRAMNLRGYRRRLSSDPPGLTWLGIGLSSDELLRGKTITHDGGETFKAEAASPKRRLCYSYLRLPYLMQIKVAQGLGLLHEDDQGKGDVALFYLIYERARQKGAVALSELAAAVEAAQAK